MRRLQLFSLVILFGFVGHGAAWAASVTDAGALLTLTPPQASSTDVAEIDEFGLGTGGFILFNVAEEGENLNARPFDENLFDAGPAYVGTLNAGPNTTSSGGWANYDNVLLGGLEFNTGGAAVRGGDGVESEVLNFEITDTPPSSFTMGIIIDNQDGAGWTPAELRVAVGDESSDSILTPVDLGTDLYLFDVGDTAVGDIVQVFLTEQVGNGGAGGLIAGLTFDSLDSPPVDIDFDDNGAINVEDIDLLVGGIASGANDPLLDLNGDGSVSEGDLTQWLSEAAEVNIGPGISYLLGDANLDGVVDATDLNSVGINWLGSALWSGGDFTADGVVNAPDLNWVGINWQSSILPAPAAPVPEPSPQLLLIASLTLLSIHARSRR